MLLLLLGAYARRLVRLGEWFGITALAAGAVVWLAWWRSDQPLQSTLLGLVLLGPGVVVWHFAHTLASLPRGLARRPGPRWSGRRALRLGLGLSFLARPWYWSLLAVSTAAALMLLPLAFWVSLLR